MGERGVAVVAAAGRDLGCTPFSGQRAGFETVDALERAVLAAFAKQHRAGIAALIDGDTDEYVFDEPAEPGDPSPTGAPPSPEWPEADQYANSLAAQLDRARQAAATVDEAG